MKRNLLIAMLTTLALVLISTTSYAQGKGKQPPRMQAAEGEEVWVIVNTVKADKREQFEKFMFEIFLPTVENATGDERKVFIATRLLMPTKVNEDGTYHYVFLMDPVIKGADYQFLPQLTRAYGAAKAQEYAKMLEDTLAKPQIGYSQTQGKLNRPKEKK